MAHQRCKFENALPDQDLGNAFPYFPSSGIIFSISLSSYLVTFNDYLSGHIYTCIVRLNHVIENYKNNLEQKVVLAVQSGLIII